MKTFKKALISSAVLASALVIQSAANAATAAKSVCFEDSFNYQWKLNAYTPTYSTHQFYYGTMYDGISSYKVSGINIKGSGTLTLEATTTYGAFHYLLTWGIFSSTATGAWVKTPFPSSGTRTGLVDSFDKISCNLVGTAQTKTAKQTGPLSGAE